MATFANKMSLAQLKANNSNQPINVGPSPKEGIFLFACGNTSGVISKAAYAAFINPATPDSAFQYADVVDDATGEVWPMITLVGNSGPQTVVATR